MTDYDWGEVTGKVVERLRAPKVPPVPEAIVRQAQRSWDGVEVDGEKCHILSHAFMTSGQPDPEKARAFYGHIRNAGHHTKPQTSVSAVIDPDNDGSTHVVSWKAGARRGRATT